MPITNNRLSEWSAEELASTGTIAGSVEHLIKKYTQAEYGDDFILTKPFRAIWRTHRRPKKSLFSSAKPSGYLVDVTLIKTSFPGSNHVFIVEFQRHTDGSAPVSKRVIAFCKELSEATDLPIRGRAGSGLECFYGYWNDHASTDYDGH